MTKYVILFIFSFGAVLISGCGKTTINQTPAITDTVKSYIISGTVNTLSTIGFTGRAGAPSCVVNGKIYVLGGEASGNITLNTVEVYDPANDSWSTPSTTGTFSPRKYLTAAVVKNKIYAIGGYSNGAINTLEVFDPSTNVWNTPITTGSFTARYALTSCVVNDKIYVIGGFDNSNVLSTIEVFDPATNAWSTPQQHSSMTPRQFLASAVAGGKIYVFGGTNGTSSSNALNTLEVFDPATSSWSTPETKSPMTMSPRFGLSASNLNGEIYVVGGTNGYEFYNTFEVYDPNSSTWGVPNVAGSFVPRSYLSSCVLNDRMYATGGFNGQMVGATEVFTQTP